MLNVTIRGVENIPIKLTDQRFLLKTPHVADTVGLGHANRGRRNNVSHERRVETLDISNLIDGIFPSTVNRVKDLGIGLHSLVRELDADGYVSSCNVVSYALCTYRMVCLGESRVSAQGFMVVTLLIRSVAGILVKLANSDGGMLIPA